MLGSNRLGQELSCVGDALDQVEIFGVGYRMRECLLKHSDGALDGI